MISKTIRAAAEVILIGQTNLTTTNLSALKGHCESTGIMCAHASFIWDTIPVVSICPLHASSPSALFQRFPECPSTTPKQLDKNATSCRVEDCSESNGSGKKARLSSQEMQSTVWLCCIILHSTQAAVSAQTGSQHPLWWIGAITKHCCKIVSH